MPRASNRPSKKVKAKSNLVQVAQTQTQKEQLDILGRAVIGQAAPDTEGKKKRTFALVAYTGGLLTSQYQYGWDYPVVCDLNGFQLNDGVFPILDNHGPGWFTNEKPRDSVVGQSSQASVSGNQLQLAGDMFDNPNARGIIELADQGFAWQTSIGAKVLEKNFVNDGATIEVNGQVFTGPIYVATKTQLREVSFVVLGDDAHTKAVIARFRPNSVKGKKVLTPNSIKAADDKDTKADEADFAAWCKAEGYGDPESMTERMKAKMRAEYDAQADDDEEDEDDEEDGGKKAKASAAEDEPDDTMATDDNDKEKVKPTSAKAGKKMKAFADGANNPNIQAMRDEATRVAQINAMLAGKSLTIPCEIKGRIVERDLLETALRDGWTAKRVKLEVIRAERNTPGPTWYSPSQPTITQEVIECALLQHGNCQLGNDSHYVTVRAGRTERRVPESLQRTAQGEYNARYNDKVQQYARDLFANSSHKHFNGSIGMQRVLLLVAEANGYRARQGHITNGNLEDVLRAAFSRPMDIRAEGGSTISIQNLLANVLNKWLLTGYTHTDMSWRMICSIRPFKDFKPSKSINVTGDFLYVKLNADGQIQNAAMTDEAFANQIDTFARKLGISRQMIINDDISGLTTVPMLMGIGANDSISLLFWKLFLNPPVWPGDSQAFWYQPRNVAVTGLGGGAANSNALAAGASSALSSTSLQSAVTLFDKQVKANGQPLGVPPAILLYPPELDATAVELMNAQFIVYGGATVAKQPNTNVFQGRFTPVKSPYLSNTNYTGNSTTAWYLMSNPELTGLSTIEMGFLNGQETPTVQTAQANFNELGIDIRGFHDYGAAMQNPRASVRSPGA